MSSWHSYPSSFALGHKALGSLLLDPVTVEEKVDGSQFSFGYFAPDASWGGGFRFKSKGTEIYVSPDGVASQKMFQKAIESVLSRGSLLRPGWTYRAEYLPKPKANVLAYDRTPIGYLIVFDINSGQEEYLSPLERVLESERIGLEPVPVLYQGKIEDIEIVKRLLDSRSILGGQKVEGVVVKNYSRYGLDKKILIGKYVSEAFKEIHEGEWRKANPHSADIVQSIILALKTPARWQKAVQHLTEAGKLEGSPRDIGSLFKEVPKDVLAECEDEIKKKLFEWAWPQISRGMTAGMAEWYKTKLLEEQPVGDKS